MGSAVAVSSTAVAVGGMGVGLAETAVAVGSGSFEIRLQAGIVTIISKSKNNFFINPPVGATRRGVPQNMSFRTPKRARNLVSARVKIFPYGRNDILVGAVHEPPHINQSSIITLSPASNPSPIARWLMPIVKKAAGSISITTRFTEFTCDRYIVHINIYRCRREYAPVIFQ